MNDINEYIVHIIYHYEYSRKKLIYQPLLLNEHDGFFFSFKRHKLFCVIFILKFSANLILLPILLTMKLPFSSSFYLKPK